MKLRGDPGGLAPPVLVDMADRPIKKSADIIWTFLYNEPFKFWFACFVGNFVFFTSPRRVKKCTLLRVSPSLPFMSTGTRRCQHRPILFEQSRALAVLKFVFLLLFILGCVSSILQKPTQARLVHKSIPRQSLLKCYI